MGEGHGYGKTILFGEHFVVYGLPAIACAIGAKTTAKVEAAGGPGVQLVDNRPETPGYKEGKKQEQKESVMNILRFCGTDPSRQGIRVTFGGDLVAASGIGASAASCVALARALNQEFRLGYVDERINEAAYEGEKGYHGTPSGIDNTVATYGGVIWFQRTPGQQRAIIEKIRVREPIPIVIGNTGITSSTSEVISEVRRVRDKDPDRFEEILRSYSRIAQEAREALRGYELERLGRLMNENQALLREIGVSCRELDELIDAAAAHGALGAKLTGTGRGGLMIALTRLGESQKAVAEAIAGMGYTAWTTSIGV
ncbi:MAG: mevalonate kinase [Candidatus Bathyarchaeia archaeon]